MKKNAIEEIQRAQCRKSGTKYFECCLTDKVGIALNVSENAVQIHGLRHPPEAQTTGWFIWAGTDLSSDEDFFKPLHAEHLVELCPQVIKFLGLPPGWRFLKAGDYEDVWYDESLLKI